jgi:hypothetical protein
MSVDLVRNDKGVHLSGDGWRKLTDLACEHGWEPMGTQAPRPEPEEDEFYEDWDGNYSSNNRQLVRSDDAANLGKALARALEDPTVQAMEPELIAKIEEMIDLCEGGGFFIL